MAGKEKIVPLEDESKRSWRVVIDGKEIEPKELIIESEGYGKLVLGERPEGFHGWWFEPENGGVMTIPWVKTPDGEILVGLVREHRPNMGPEEVLSAPGGFIDEGETAADAQSREADEESGLDTTGAELLPGLPVNSDRLYFAQDPHEGEGMTMYHLEFPYDGLEQSEENKGWMLPKPGVVSHNKESELVFIPWREAVELSADSLTLAAIAKLLSKIL